MHEYGLMEALIARVLEESRSQGARPILRIRVDVGELAFASPESLVTAFEVLARGTALEKTRLEIHEVPSRVRCDACGFAGTAVDLDLEDLHEAPPLICPGCASLLTVTEGRGVVLTEIEFGSGNEEGTPGGQAWSSPS